MKEKTQTFASNSDIEELHSRHYLIYENENEANEALLELHDCQYMVLSEEATMELKEEYNASFNEFSRSMSSFSTFELRDSFNVILPEKKTKALFSKKKKRATIIQSLIVNQKGLLLSEDD